MNITNQDKDFFKANRDRLLRFYQERIEDLKNDMISESKEERDGIVEAVKENQRWISEVKRITDEKQPRKDTGV